MRKGLQGVVDRFEEKTAVIRFFDKQELMVQKKYLPAKIKAGEAIDVFFRENVKETEKRRKKVFNLLADVFKI